MKILFVASECAPFVKTGGLADVVSALPKSLKRAGASVRIMLPGYPDLADLVAAGKELLRVDDGILGEVRVDSARAEGLDLLLVNAPSLYHRAGSPYLDPDGRDWPDNHLRFAALGRMAATVAQRGIGRGRGRWRPDILHSHDWQAGLGPAYLRLGPPSAVRTVTTIHNIAFQGLFGAEQLPLLSLPETEFRVEGFEYHGRISFLKAGLVWADRISTVSPTYARELMTPEFGMGFEGILGTRSGDVSGILNGVDLEVWNPRNRSGAGGELWGGRASGTPGQPAGPAGPLRPGTRAGRAAVLRREQADEAKGVGPAAGGPAAARHPGSRPDLARFGGRGSGGRFPCRRRRLTGSDRSQDIGYDEKLSHLMQGGADCILVPSRFEPCGLTQLYGLRYGCLPLVARTGGLADTVIDLNEAGAGNRCGHGVSVFPDDRECPGIRH